MLTYLVHRLPRGRHHIRLVNLGCQYGKYYFHHSNRIITVVTKPHRVGSAVAFAAISQDIRVKCWIQITTRIDSSAKARA